MAKAAAARKTRARASFLGAPGGGVAREAGGVLLAGFVALAAVALWSYSPSDAVLEWTHVENRASVAGATVAGLLHRFAGVAAWGVVMALGAVAASLLTAGRLAIPRHLWIAGGVAWGAIATLASVLPMLSPEQFAGVSGGWVGGSLAGIESLLISTYGAFLVNALLLAVGLAGFAGVPAGEALAALARGGVSASRIAGRGALAFGGWAHRMAFAGADAAQRGWTQLEVWRERRARRERVEETREQLAGAEEAAAPPVAIAGEEPLAPAVAAETPAPPARPRGAAPAIVDHARERKREPEQETFTFAEPTSLGPYEAPDVAETFQAPPENARKYDRESLIMNSRILEKKLADFGVMGRVVTVHPGPVITMYEFEPAPGVKVNRITNLSDDLALALRALSIRIIAPIPGKSVVGIEVPNAERETVYIRDLLEARSFRGAPSKLTLALGKDIFGNPVEADLATMPHLLVAGATGTGKSVFLNSLLCSILVRATPDEVKLLLVDPKLLELSIYEKIPHLIADVVTNPKRASAALQGIVLKMEERYQQMAALGVRNIAQFNARVDEAKAAGMRTYRLRPKPGEAEGREVEYARIPYIVVVIDELADLMVVSAKDVEESLQRLAQMARASGIHLVLATQRPSVDVLTGIIKANFPARISFQVSSRTDSRTILDQGGADQLLGQGDMLFLPPGTSKLARLHGPYVSEREVTKLVEHLRRQGAPKFDEELLRIPEEAEEGGEAIDPEDVDEHYDMAVRIVAETRNASISYLQRRLKVGYNRAARMIEQMEREGVVGPQIGVRPREVFIAPIGEDADA
ncbi:MAG: DNA translocase FtsK 4TM domain-containing protein [Deltaproteobacteria bacterium]|nr:DNA translocase FtsK 4TM domain-containing protein [Deltaproteobacteria bacterium]